MNVGAKKKSYRLILHVTLYPILHVFVGFPSFITEQSCLLLNIISCGPDIYE